MIKYKVFKESHLLSGFAVVLFLTTNNANGEPYFNPSLLSGDVSSIADLSRYNKDEGQPSGVYRVEIYLNDEYIGSQDLKFEITEKKLKNDDTGLYPCLTTKWLKKYGINIAAIEKLSLLPDDQCINIMNYIEHSNTVFDFETQRLNISIPQALVLNNYRGFIPPEDWENGINAALLNYRFSGSNTDLSKPKSQSDNYYLSLESGINLGSWRLRNQSAWVYAKNSKNTTNNWDSLYSYAQRAIISLKSELTIGDSSTNSDIFDGFAFRGISLASDDNMLPESLKGFAPTIHGIANSNAIVTVEQNGYVVYQTNVPPGPFEINDLYATTSSDDLNVTVKEANGSTSQFTVPFSSIPILQREGRIKYGLTAGEFRSGSSMQNKPTFIQGLMILGLPAGLTFYQGIQAAEHHNSLAFGFGQNFGEFGALSADITHANTQLADGSHHSGQSLRFLYAKSLSNIGTTFQLLGYRYSTKGFYNLAESAYKNMSGYNTFSSDRPNDDELYITDYHNLYYTKRGRAQFNISQQLGDYGAIYINGSYQTYWNTSETDQQLQMGYNGNWQDINYNLNASINKNAGIDNKDKRIAFNISIPLNTWLAGGGKGRDIINSSNSIYATYATTYDNNNKATHLAGISGTLLEDNNLSYSVQQGYANQGQGATGGIATSYRGSYGDVNAGYSYGKHWQQVSYGASGGVVLHSEGITFSQPLGASNILVEAAGASGVSVENATGVKTDWSGYTVIPHASSYRNNRVALDVTTLPENADIDDPVVNVVPTKGAIVKAEFSTKIGARAMIMLTQVNGKPLPFGSVVYDETRSGSGIVGDNGQLFISGLAPQGVLKAKWGAGDNQQCTIHYQLSENNNRQGINYAKAKCS